MNRLAAYGGCAMVIAVHCPLRCVMNTMHRHEQWSYLTNNPLSPTIPVQKRPIVFIHGVCSSSQVFAYLAMYFAKQGYRIYVPNLLGHGEREEVIEKASVHDYVDDMGAFLQTVVFPAHKNIEPILVGYSMGGLIAQVLATQFAFHHVVLIVPAPPAGVAYRPRRFLPARGTIISFIFFLFGKVYKGAGTAFAADFKHPARIMTYLNESARQGYKESPRALIEIAFSHIKVKKHKITAPITIIGAADDQIIDPSVARSVAEYYHAPLLVVDDADHLCIVEEGAKERVAEVLLKVLTYKL